MVNKVFSYFKEIMIVQYQIAFIYFELKIHSPINKHAQSYQPGVNTNQHVEEKRTKFTRNITYVHRTVWELYHLCIWRRHHIHWKLLVGFHA